MQIEKSIDPTIQPVKVTGKEITIEDIDQHLIKLIAQKQPNLLEVYNKYNSLNTTFFVRDLLKNLEDYFKSQKVENDNEKIILQKTIETLKNQISVLELYSDNNKNTELLILLFVTLYSHIKKFLY